MGEKQWEEKWNSIKKEMVFGEWQNQEARLSPENDKGQSSVMASWGRRS